MAHQGRGEEALALLDEISDTNPGVKDLIRYTVYSQRGQFEEALREAECVNHVSDSILRITMSRNLIGSLSDYFEMSRKVKDAELTATRFRTWFIIVVFTVILTLLIFIGLLVYRRQQREIDQKILFVEQLSESLNKSWQENTEGIAIIKSLLSTKYAWLEELTGIMLRNSDSKVAKQKMADAITNFINELSIRSEKIKELENEVDSVCDNLYTDFNTDLPNLKDADYRLFLFSVLRLSNPAISLLLKEDKIEAVYNRKRRLKDKIKLLSPEKRDRYLSYL